MATANKTDRTIQQEPDLECGGSTPHSKFLRLLGAALTAFILITRFAWLGDKPIHHDESLFGVHAYHLRMTGDYDFNPILHGPFLEDISALIFLLFGDSDATARLWSATAGALLIFAAWRLLRRRLGARAAAWAAALFAVSPTFMYYSRFNRNDVPFTLAALVFVLCVVRFLDGARLRWWFWALLAAAWMICIEETYVIFLFTAITFPVAAGLIELASGRASSLRETAVRLASSRRNFGILFAGVTASGLAAGGFLIVLLHTTFFRHPNHWLGPLEGIRYWAGQHAEQRIFGEYHYYVPILLIYEFLVLALLGWGVAQTLRRAPWLRGWPAWAWAAWSVALLAALWPYTFPRGFASLTHMTRGWHLWLAVEVFALSGAACAVLAFERRMMESFFMWWAVVSFLAYSYAGEKVPWIAVHILAPMILSAACFAREIWEGEGVGRGEEGEMAGCQSAPRRWIGGTLAGMGLAVTVVVAIRLCFFNAANPAERHVYTHTTPEYKAMAAEVHDIVARTGAGTPRTFPLVLAGDSLWPGQWYFRRWPLMRAGPVTPDAPILILDEYVDPLHRETSALSKYPWLLQTHVVRRVPFREWWHQEPHLATLARLADIWMVLVPRQYRRNTVTDAAGRPVGWIGDRAKLPNMTVEDEIRASSRAWRDVFDYLVFRRDFDPYRRQYPTRGHMAVLLCVRKDLYKQWSHLGGRHEDGRSRFAGRLPR